MSFDVAFFKDNKFEIYLLLVFSSTYVNVYLIIDPDYYMWFSRKKDIVELIYKLLLLLGSV